MKNTVSPKNKKLPDKVFSQSMLISIFCMLMCLFLLCSMTYAWFRSSTSNASNVIKSSFFDLAIDVRDENGNAIHVQHYANAAPACTFANAGTYTVTLKMTENTTASKGYCQLTASSMAEKLQTEPISKDPSVGVEELTFTIQVEAGTVVSFESKWGISAAADIAHGSTFVLIEEPEIPENPDTPEPPESNE